MFLAATGVKLWRNMKYGGHLGRHLELRSEPWWDFRGLFFCDSTHYSGPILKFSACYQKCPMFALKWANALGLIKDSDSIGIFIVFVLFSLSLLLLLLLFCVIRPLWNTHKGSETTQHKTTKLHPVKVHGPQMCISLFTSWSRQRFWICSQIQIFGIWSISQKLHVRVSWVMAQIEGLVMSYIFCNNTEKLRRIYGDVMTEKLKKLHFLPYSSFR